MTQTEALDILKTGANVYLTGSAGSGKTFVLNSYINYLKMRNKKVGVTASTGVAATQLNGMTINSWAGIGIKGSISESEVIDLLKRKYLHRRFKDTEVLIIDEISMLASYTLESVDKILQAFKRNDLPFGGIQVILCGDFFQLPPIQANPKFEARRSKQYQNTNDQNPKKDSSNFGIHTSDLSPQFVYKSPVWEQLDLKVCYLEKPFRQEDQRFLHMLDQIRGNKVTSDTWMLLKDRFIKPLPDNITPTKLFTHNEHADAVNAQELAKIRDELHVYSMQSEGNEMLVNSMKKSCLAPEKLLLKKGALVMFVKNNYEAGYVNGTLGRVIEISDKDGYPVVETFAGKRIKAIPAEWEIDEDGDMKATISQIPLRLAWAITIHKSQGMSLDAAEIDLGKSFVAGLGYVALSRVRTLEGIKLRSINRTALSVNNEVIRIDRVFREQSDELSAEVRNSYWHKKNGE